MRLLFTALIMALLPVCLFAQTLKVIDEETGKPIEKVHIYSTSASVYTDAGGEADLSTFNKSDALFLRHPSYQYIKITWAELQELDFTIKLKPIPTSFKTVVISANRWEENIREVPNKISVITANEAEFQNPQTAADLLGTSDEVFIQKSQLGGGSPMLRGFSTNRVLLVVDGVRMNTAIFRAGNLQNVIVLDPNAIESTEVIFGPGSVIYGSDAIGGVMDFHTLDPKFSSGDELLYKGNFMTRYSSADNEGVGHADFNLGARKWSSVTSVSYSNFGDLRMGSNGDHNEYLRPEYVERIGGVDTVLTNDDPNVQRVSGYDQVNFMQKVRFLPGENWEVTAGFHYSESSDVPRYDRLIEYRSGRLRYADWYYGPAKWIMGNLTVNYNKETSLFDEAKLIMAYQFNEESRHDRKFNDPVRYSRTDQVDAMTLNLYFYKSLSARDSLFYGVEVVRNWIGSTGFSTNIVTGATEPIDTRYPDGSDWSSYAAYVSYKSNLNEQLTFVAGARYSYASLYGKFDKTFYPFPFDEIKINTGALTGSAGIVWRPNGDWQFNINGSTGFRAPNIDDAAKVFESAPGSVVVPNENLDAEYIWNIDVGVTRILSNRVFVEATGFYSLLQNAMVRRDFTFNGQEYIEYDGELSRVQAIVNAEEATVYGVQLAFYADILDNWSLRSNLSWATGETDQGDAVRHVPPIFGSTHLIYQRDRLKTDFYADYNGELPYEDLALEERDKPTIYAIDENGNPYCPAWWTLNLKASYVLNENFTLFGGLENILDYRYRPYSSGIVAPGRNLIVGLRCGF
jgi:hemoglobin/transferrin/lactoferrin receptor protein